MKVQCDRSELAERLQAIGGVVAAGPTTKPILLDFHLKATADDLIVEVTDLDIAARIQIDRVEVLEEGELALSAARLQSLVREIPGNAIFIESLDGSRTAMLRTDNYEFKLLGEDPSEFPEVVPFAADASLTFQREKFVEMLRRVGVAACRDSSRYQLTGVFCEVENGEVVMTATDGKRLTNDRTRIDADGGEPAAAARSSIIPNRAVDVLLKVLANGEETIQVAFLETEVQVSFGHGQVGAKLIEGSFPEYRAAISGTPKTKVNARKSDLLAAVRSASLVTSRETSTIAFLFEPDFLSLKTQASEIGESRIQVPIELTGEAVEIQFNPVFFLDALRTVHEEQVRIELFGKDQPGAIRSGPNYRHFLMPLVLGEA